MGSIDKLNRQLSSLVHTREKTVGTKSMSTLNPRFGSKRKRDQCVKIGLATPRRVKRKGVVSKDMQKFFKHPVELKVEGKVITKKRSRKKHVALWTEDSKTKAKKNNSKKTLKQSSKNTSRTKISRKDSSVSKKSKKKEKSNIYQKYMVSVTSSEKRTRSKSKTKSKSKSKKRLKEKGKAKLKEEAAEATKIASKTTDLKNLEYEQEKDDFEVRLSLKQPVRRRKKKFKFLKKSTSKSRGQNVVVELAEKRSYDFQKKTEKSKSYNIISVKEPVKIEKKMNSLNEIKQIPESSQLQNNQLPLKKDLLFPKQLRKRYFVWTDLEEYCLPNGCKFNNELLKVYIKSIERGRGIHNFNDTLS